MASLKLNEISQRTSDDGDFVALLTQHQRILHIFIASVVPFIDSRDDILQEVNIVLWKKRATFEFGTNFRAWAITVARFVTMNQQKKFGREKALVFGDSAIKAIADHWIEEQINPDQRLHLLTECLTTLEVSDRNLLLDCYESRGAIQRLALERKQSSSTIRGILLRLRRQLLRCIHMKSPNQTPRHER